MKTLFKIIITVPVISSFLIGIIFFIAGIYETIISVLSIFKGQMHTDHRPGVKLFEALDVFLIGFLFIIFSIGFSQLFFPKQSKIAIAIDSITPEWLKVENFTQLKLILWDTILTTLVVTFFGEAFKSQGHFEWELMIIPIAILLISLSRFFIKVVKK